MSYRTPTRTPQHPDAIERALEGTARTRFVVVLEGAAGADTPHTLRFLLKYLLRSRSLRCTEVRELNHRDGVRGRADDGDGNDRRSRSCCGCSLPTSPARLPLPLKLCGAYWALPTSTCTTWRTWSSSPLVMKRRRSHRLPLTMCGKCSDASASTPICCRRRNSRSSARWQNGAVSRRSARWPDSAPCMSGA